MSGSNMFRPRSFKADVDFSQTLGMFLLSPRQALKNIAAQPRIFEAFLAIGMAALGVLLSNAAQQGQCLSEVFSQNLRLCVSQAGPFLASWFLSVAAWHGVSRMFGKVGSFKAFFCLMAWAASVYWLYLPASHILANYPKSAMVFHLVYFSMRVCFLLAAWKGLQLVYDWSAGDALAVTILPYILVKIFFWVFFSALGRWVFLPLVG